MSWKKFSNETPQTNILLVVFRVKKRQYTVAKFEYVDPTQVRPKFIQNNVFWNTGSNKLKIDGDDMWCILEPVTIIKTYE